MHPVTAVLDEPKTVVAADMQLHQFLLEPTPDKEIAREVQSLGSLIQQHVDSHYHMGAVVAETDILKESLVRLEIPDAAAVAELCLEPETRQVGLQHVILRVVFASIDVHSHIRTELSMLPESVAAFLEEAPLRREDLIDGSPALNAALKPFAKSPEQTSHLEAVIIECAKLGYVLLSHPSDWLLITQDERKTDGASRVVVEAGLVKLSDQSSQIPSKIRRSLQLVQACTQDLQHLIQLRNDNISVLQAKPLDLNRVNSVIGQANSGLAEARRIVEKFRPEAHPRGKTPLRKRLAWVLGDSTEFQSQLPVISRHHATVLAEINHVRQLALWASPSRGKGVEAGTGAETADEFDNLLLLGDLIGDDVSVLSKGSSATLRPQSSYTFFDSEKQMIEYSDLPEPVFPDKAAEQFPTSKRLHHPEGRSSHCHTDKTGASSSDTADDSGLTILLDGQINRVFAVDSYRF
ncbi:hypothetical protein CDD80_4698 [Ophiocordyceps camponoti-rufipedis]|uniref:Uncharacterized protein n=1 Tax=Ophiocordyceps camponoti-rufipedis TaxID=2004952 RepID=A0A2C5ZJR6_9HYPO|nr:hypothetical protein CDD80_4698 [Ophiocordyceps camponoti-rufipedis]